MNTNYVLRCGMKIYTNITCIFTNCFFQAKFIRNQYISSCEEDPPSTGKLTQSSDYEAKTSFNSALFKKTQNSKRCKSVQNTKNLKYSFFDRFPDPTKIETSGSLQI